MNKGTAAWLDNDKFVFHTSSSLGYLKRLKRRYAWKYNLETVIYKNPKYRTKALKLKSVDTDAVVEYMKDKTPVTLQKKKVKKLASKKEKKQVKQKKVEKPKSVNFAKVRTKKDVRNVRKGIIKLQQQEKYEVDTVKLKKYFLAKTAPKPFIFSSKKPIYNLYLTSILNKGTAAWLDNDKFVFHTSSSLGYLKRLKRRYKWKYNLETVIYKNPQYRTKALQLKSVDTDGLVEYMKDKIL